MKVKIGPYKNWFGPYQLAETLCFWAKDVEDEYGIKSKPDWVHNFGEWLAHGSVEPDPAVGERSKWHDERPETWLYKFLKWVDSKRSRKVSVHIDRWDTWGMDETLAYIVLPMLKQLKDSNHGSPFVDDEDVPEELRSTSVPAPESENDVDDNHHRRWYWVLDEMIFAFETKVGVYKDWEDQFHTGEFDFEFIKQEDGTFQMIRGANDTSNYDKDGATAYQKRISNGFRLFGRYYEGLWT